MAYTVMCDPGHGNYDPGACGYNLRESDIVLSIGKKVKSILQNNGVKVLMTRESDVFVGLAERAEMANNAGVDLFVSIHCNAATGNAYGTETYTYTSYSNGAYNLAGNINNNIVSSLGTFNRGVKQANFAVLRRTSMPAILVETAFIDNAHDNNLLNNHQDLFALAIAKGILSYFGISCDNSTVGNNETSENASSNDYQYGIVTASALNVRNGRGTNCKIIGSLSNGEKVKIDYIYNGWASIYFGDHGGFVSAKYLKLV